MNHTTDTPRTDASKVDKGGMTFVSLEFAQELERELKNAQEAYLKSVERDDYLTQELAASQAEVERLREQLASTKQLAIKFWEALEENGFKLELPK
jgi:uroporphyrinogen-III synthase